MTGINYPYQTSGPCPRADCPAGQGEPCTKYFGGPYKSNSRHDERVRRDVAKYQLEHRGFIRVPAEHCGTCKCTKELSPDESREYLAALERGESPTPLIRV